MLPDRVMNPGPLTYESGALPIALRGLAIKVVICGKYINLNKIIKISDIALKFHRLLIFVILYSLECCLKKCFNMERSKGIFVRENLKK